MTLVVCESLVYVVGWLSVTDCVYVYLSEWVCVLGCGKWDPGGHSTKNVHVTFEQGFSDRTLNAGLEIPVFTPKRRN